jgi:hypothetical protein
MMAKIDAYKFESQPVQSYGHFHADSNTFTPIPEDKAKRIMELHETLDDITLAVEAGVVDLMSWPQMFFEDKGSFKAFLLALGDYDNFFRLNDRWYHALAHLNGGPGTEEGFVQSADISAALEHYCTENKIDTWKCKATR